MTKILRAIRVLFGLATLGYGIAWGGAYLGYWHAEGPDLFLAAVLSFYAATDAFGGEWS